MQAAAPELTHQRSLIRRNFVCHCLEGGFYMGGLAFLAPDSVLPKMVDSLGGKAAVIAIMPAVLPAAFAVMGLFVAPVVENLSRLKPWVLTFGFIQRLPYLIAGLLLLYGDQLAGWLLPIVVLTPVVSGLIGGVGVQAWMEMVTRMIPERQRASGWATRYIIQACIGVAAGPAIHMILTRHPGPDGYAMLHLIAFGFLALSFGSQVWMKEFIPSALPPQDRRPAYSKYLASLPGLLRTRPLLIKLVWARFFGLGYLMILGFLTKHALAVTDRPEPDEGYFVTAQQIGTILGSVLAGWLGNRQGGKVLMITARTVCVLVCLAVCVIQSFPLFVALFFVVGFGLFIDRVGDLTLAAELCPVERRSTLQALLSFCNVFAFMAGTSLAGQVFSHTHSIAAVAGIAAAMAAISILILRRIPEPRHGLMSVHTLPPVRQAKRGR